MPLNQRIYDTPKIDAKLADNRTPQSKGTESVTELHNQS